MSKTHSNISKLFLDLPLGAEFQATVQSNSMLPIFRIGDKVLLKKISFSKVKPGDIICFYQNLNKNLIVHRVIKKQYFKKNKTTKLLTKGDSLTVVDFYPVLAKNFIGQVSCKARPNRKNSNLRKFLFVITQRFFLKYQLLRDFFY